MADSRQLIADYLKQFHAENPIGYEGWDHRAFSWISSIILAAICLILLILSCCKATSGAVQGLRSFLSSMMAACLTLGIAHKLLDNIYDNNEEIGVDWSGNNSLWMYFWAAAMVSTSFMTAGMVHTAVVPVASGAQQCNEAIGAILTGVSYILAIAVSIYSVYTFRAEGKIDDAQRACVIWGFGASVVAFVLNILCFFGLGGEGCCHCQRVLMMIGNVAMGLGWILIAFSPQECRKNGEDREGCPWPEEFNQNQMFHVLQFIAVCFIFCSVITQEDVRAYTPVSQTQPMVTSHAATAAPMKPAREPTFFESLFGCCNRRGAGPPGTAVAPIAHGH